MELMYLYWCRKSPTTQNEIRRHLHFKCNKDKCKFDISHGSHLSIEKGVQMENLIKTTTRYRFRN